LENVFVQVEFIDWSAYEDHPYVKLIRILDPVLDVDFFKKAILIDKNFQEEGFS
jgi:hypothetical protein